MSDTRARRASRRLASLALALAILPAAGATGTFAASPAVATPPTLAVSTAITPPLGAPATPGAFRINLARGDDYVRQTTFVQCVGASVQMMLNIMDPGADRTRRTQHRLQVQARAWSGPRPDGRTREGAGVFGWAAALNLNDGGPYGVVGADTLGEAMRLAAIAMVEHHRPVGLLVWQGRHAWVMSGFQATGDPRRGDFRVTKAYILDPLHPYGSKVWGPARRPERPSASRPSAGSSSRAGREARGTRCPAWPRCLASTSSSCPPTRRHPASTRPIPPPSSRTHRASTRPPHQRRRRRRAGLSRRRKPGGPSVIVPSDGPGVE